MTVERREEKVGKPLLTGSALGGNKFRNICDMETIPPEEDFLVNNAHFPSFTPPKFPFLKVLNRQRSGRYMAVGRRVESRPATDSNRQVDNLFNRQRTIGAFSLLGIVLGNVRFTQLWKNQIIFIQRLITVVV